METHILKEQQAKFPQYIEKIDLMRVYSSERLWKQLSDILLVYMKLPEISQGTNLRDLYEGFVKDFYNEIDEIKLIRFLLKAADQYGEIQNRIDFLQKFELYDKQPQLMLKIKIAEYMLLQNKVEEVGQLLKDYKQLIEKFQDVEPLLYSLLYNLAFNFYRVKQNFEEFYINALQYIAYTPDTDMDQEEKVNLSLEMAYAVLISPQIYNYSELLSLTVLVSLQQSQHAWVYTLLETFNKGDVRLFEQQLQQFNNQIQQSQLSKNIQILNEKIRIMAFLELAFQLPKNNRVCSFEQIANATQIDRNNVENLVMRTISKELIKGTINQITQQVNITYVVPRVLSKEKIEVMLKKFDHWEKTLKTLLNQVDQIKQDNN